MFRSLLSDDIVLQAGGGNVGRSRQLELVGCVRGGVHVAFGQAIALGERNGYRHLARPTQATQPTARQAADEEFVLAATDRTGIRAFSDHELSEALPRGADDYIVKPYEQKQLLAKASHALELKTVQDRERQLAYQLYQVNLQLEDSLRSRNADLREAHNALLFTIAKLAESRDGETPGHIKRMQLYTQILAREVGKSGPWQGLVDDRFLEMLDRCVPLHDIGKIGLPDDILLKPASLSPSERQMVEEHPVIGDKMLEALADEYGASLDFLGTARVIVRHHHERYDGKGYPDKLAGDAIPPAARLVAVADVYDALRRMRLYKPAMSHAAAIKLMTERSPGQFDPALVAALTRCQADFERVYDEVEE